MPGMKVDFALMSNEDVAVLAKAGDAEATAELWERCHRLIWKLMHRYLINCSVTMGNVGVEISDLDQECFLVMVDALKAFSPEKGWVFNAFLTWQLKKRFDRICGRYKKKDALNEAERLEAPIVANIAKPKEDEEELGIFLADPEAETAIQDVVENEAQNEIARDVRTAVRRLPELSQTVIVMKYCRGADYAQIAKKTGKSKKQVIKIHRDSLKMLEKDCQIKNAAKMLGII